MIGLILAAVSVSVPLPQLHVEGSRLLDAKGRPVRLRGVNAASLEWTVDGEGHILETIRVATHDWKANIVRLPLSQDRWFGKAPGQTDGGKAYRAVVKQAVDACAEGKAYALLDLHWNNAGMWGKNIGQHLMPDKFTAEFWKSCAAAYKNQAGVLFDLYNEPHDVTWEIWKNGGEISEKAGVGARQGPFIPAAYTTPGMQKLLDTVRAAGAKNVVVVGGLDWSYDLSGFLKGYSLSDPKGHGTVLACHDYPFKGDTIDQFLPKLDAAMKKFPVIVSEFGDSPKGDAANLPSPWVKRTLQELDRRGASYIAWDMHPSAGPCLIQNWKYEPTASFGALVKESMAH